MFIYKHCSIIIRKSNELIFAIRETEAYVIIHTAIEKLSQE